MTTSSFDGEFGAINWPDEAEAVINDIKNHVRNIFISNVLPSTDLEIYLNCETFEQKRLTIRLSGDGYQIIGNDFNRIDDEKAVPYETPYALLNQISPGYVESFGNALSAALFNLERKSDQ